MLEVLTDCGASEIFARRATIEDSPYLVTVINGHDDVRVKMADGSIVVAPKVLIVFPIKINSFESIETFYVIDLDERWDLILGMGWLEKHNPLIKSMQSRAPWQALHLPDLGVVSNEPSSKTESLVRRSTHTDFSGHDTTPCLVSSTMPISRHRLPGCSRRTYFGRRVYKVNL